MVVGLALSFKVSAMLSMTSAACSSMLLSSDSNVSFSVGYASPCAGIAGLSPSL